MAKTKTLRQLTEQIRRINSSNYQDIGRRALANRIQAQYISNIMKTGAFRRDQANARNDESSIGAMYGRRYRNYNVTGKTSAVG